MLEVNKNTYVTIAEADEMIRPRLNRYDGLRLFGKSSTTRKKKAIFFSAAEQIDNLVYPGRKTYPEQTMAFPRFPEQTVPPKIKPRAGL